MPVKPLVAPSDAEGNEGPPPGPKGDVAARASVSALAPPNSTLRLPPPARTPTPISLTRIGLANWQLALSSALTSASRTGWAVPRLAPTTFWPSVVLSMPTMSGEIWTVPSASVVWVGHWTLRPTGDSAELMAVSSDCGFAALPTGERSTGAPATVTEPMENAPVAVVVAPVCWVAVHCRLPRTTAPLPMEICPMLDVAVAVRVAPLSMEAFAPDVSPLTVSSPPGTEMLDTVVREPEDGCVVAVAASFPRPRPSGEDCGVMLLERLWLPFVDSACTGGGTSLCGRVGADPSHPWDSSEVPMAPRSIVSDSDCASRSWKFAMEVAKMMA